MTILVSSKDKSRWATEDELNFVIDIIKEQKQIENILESGTANGNSASKFKEVIKDRGQVYTFDPSMREHVWIDSNGINFYLSEFKNLKSFVPKEVLNKNKLIFIDGRHDSSGVAEDFNAVSDILLDGDVVVFHDSQGEVPVVRFCHRLRKKQPLWEYKEHTSKRGVAAFFVKP